MIRTVITRRLLPGQRRSDVPDRSLFAPDLDAVLRDLARFQAATSATGAAPITAAAIYDDREYQDAQQ